MEIIRGYGFKKDLETLVDRILSDTGNLNCIHHLIVPDQFSAELEEFILKRTDNQAYINIHVESFTYFCHEILQDTFNNKLILSEIEQDIRIRKILVENNKKLSIFRNKYDSDGFIQEIKGIISDIDSVNLEIEDFKDIDRNKFSVTLNQKIDDILKVYNEYNKTIGDEYFIGNILQVTKKHVKEWMEYRKKIGKKDNLYIVGFNDFSIAQLDLIEEFIKFFTDILFYFYIGTDTDDKTGTYSVVERYISNILIRAKKNNIEVKAVKYDNIDNGFFKVLSLNIYDSTQCKPVKKNEQVGVYELHNVVAEIKRVAVRINQLIEEGYTFNDFAVLMGDIDSNVKIIGKIFDDYDIPYFMDTNRILTTSPIYKLVMAIHKIIIYGAKMENVIELIKYGYFFSNCKEVVDYRSAIGKVENFIIKTGLRSFRSYENIVLREDDKDYEILKITIPYLCDVLKIIKEISSTKITYSEAIIKFKELCKILNLEENIQKTVDYMNIKGEIHKADQYIQLYDRLDNCINVIDENFAKEKNNVKLWLKLIVSVFSNIKLGRVPGNVDEVLVGNISRTMFIEKKYVFIIQANSGKLINTSEKYCIFNETDREELAKYNINLNQNSENMNAIVKSKFLNLLSRISDGLEISYSRVDLSGDEASKDSFIDALVSQKIGADIQKIRKMYPNEVKNINQIIEYISNADITIEQLKILLRQIYDKTIYFQAKYLLNILEEKFDTEVNPINLEINNRDTSHTISISQIEKYNTCPFSYFLSYILGIKEREEYKLSSIDKGNLYHTILENFFEGTDINFINALTKSELESIVEKYTDDYLEKYGIKFKYNFTNRNILKRIKNKLVQNLIDIKTELEELGADNIVTEMPIFYKIDEKANIRFTGKIDRVDKISLNNNFENLCRLYDYKSSSAKFDMKEIELGIKIQLPVYAKIMDMQGNHPVYLEYRSLKNKYLDTSENKTGGGKDEVIWKNDGSLQASLIKTVLEENDYKENKEKSVEDFNNILDRSLEITHETMEKIKEGKFHIKPYLISNSVNGCNFCKYSLICGFDVKNKNCRYRRYENK